MMSIKHARKAETFLIDDMKIVVEAYGKSYQGNPAGFSVKIRGTEAHYHINVLEIREAISRGLHKYLQRELGLDDLVTYMNVEPQNWVSNKPVTLCINARDGKFRMSNLDGEFTVTETTDCTSKECGMRTWKITHPDWAEPLCSAVRFENDDEYTAMSNGIDRTGFDLYEAAARLLCNII